MIAGIVLFSPALFAQTGDIFGVVTDSLSEDPLPYAVITFLGRAQAKAASADGSFFLPNLQPGTHLLSVSAPGYQRKMARAFVGQLLRQQVDVQLIRRNQDEPLVQSVEPSSIHGFVSDSVTGERIPYVNIVVIDANKGAAANAQGFYFLSGVPSGARRLAFSAVGYGKTVVPLEIDPGVNLELDVTLPPVSIQSEEVVVTGTRRGRLGELSTSFHLMSQQELKLSPVTAQEDVFHAIQVIPGIVSTSDVSSRFYVRGGAADQNLVLLDGMKIYNPYHALGIFSVFDPDVVKSVEVFTGAFPAEFGERLSSVVNITTKDARSDRFAARAHGNMLSSKLQIEGPIGRGVSLLANARRSVFPKTFEKIVGEDVPVNFYDVYAKATIRGSGNERFDVSFLKSYDDLRYADPAKPDYVWDSNAFSFSASQLISDRTFIHVICFYSRFTSKRESNEVLNLPATSTDVIDLGLRASATAYLADDDAILFGFQFLFPTFKYDFINTGGVGLMRKGSEPQVSTWAQYQGTLGPFLFSYGMHNDMTNLYYRGTLEGFFQPRLSISYKLADWWRVKASYGRYTQNVMTVNNEDDVIPSFEGWILIPEEWPAEQADHYVASLEGNVFDNLSLSTDVYFKHYGTLLSYNREKVDALDPDYIAGTEDAYGAEFLVRTTIGFADLYGSYTMSRATIKNGGSTYFPRFDRRHHINALGSFHVLRNLDLVLRWEYGSGFPFSQTVGYFQRLTLQHAIPGEFQFEPGVPYTLLGPKNNGRLPPYHRLDFSAAWRFSIASIKGTAGVSILNLYNSRNIFYYDRGTGKRVNMIPFFPSLNLTLEY